MIHRDRTFARSIMISLALAAITLPSLSYTKNGTIYTTNGSQTDVEASIAAATAGDTVRIPAGSFTWGADKNYVLVNKAITLEGAGQASTTIIISETSGKYTAAAIRISAAAVVKSFTIKGATASTRTPLSTSTADGWRISDIKYDQIGGAYFLYVGNVYGLIDNCIINSNAPTSELIFIRGPSNSWQTADSLGGKDNVFIEDCTFSGGGQLTDTNSNGRSVVRYCTINGKMKVDGHGKASNTPARGVRHMEVYGNRWTFTSGFWNAIEIRGGTARIFDNTHVLSTSHFKLTEYGSTSNAWPNFDHTYQTPRDYPIDDQIGVGEDPKSAGSAPLYIWNNKRNGVQWPQQWSNVPTGAVEEYGDTFTIEGDIIVADREYFKEVYSFDGSSGVGIGTSVQMAAITPTKIGVGFWVTNEGEWNDEKSGPDGRLYQWTGNSWDLIYTPYSYPHPLRSQDQTPLGDPSDLIIQ